MNRIRIDVIFFLVIGIIATILTALHLISLSHALITVVSTFVIFGAYQYLAPVQRQLVEGGTIPSTHTYRPDIDGLRALAVGTVVINHAFPEIIPGGFIGVDVFFVISGYLITRIIVEEIMEQRFSIVNFYARRIRRIFPALTIVLLSTVGFGLFLLYSEEFVSLGTQILAGSGFVSNIVLYQQVDYFGDLANNQPLLHLWSLGIEEQFYIFWPIIIWIATKQLRLLIPSIMLFLVSSFIINIYTIEIDAPAAFYLLPSRFWQLGIGGLIAIHTLFSPHPIPKQYGLLLSITGLALYIVGLFVINKNAEFPGWYALIPTISAALLILSHTPNWISSQVLSNRLMVWIGKISFPLYLWHWPLLVFGFMTLEHRFTPMLRIAVLVCSILLSAITYLYIEKPIRFATARRVPTYVFIVGILLTAGIGWSIHTQKLVSRLPNFASYPIKTTVIEQPCNIVFDINASDDALAKASKGICTIRKGPTNKSEYVVIGDSHAHYFAGGMIKASKKQVTLYAYHGCVPLLGVDRKGIKCLTNNPLSEVFAYLRTHPTNHTHRYVVLVGRFALIEPTSLNTSAGANGILFLPDRSQTDTQNNPQTIIDVGLRNTLAQISNLPNTSVIVVHQVPELQFTPKNCARIVNIMQQDINQDTNTICQTPRNDVIKHFARYRNAVDTVLADFPSVTAFNTDELFCDATSCYATVDGKWAYKDHHHLNLYGATKVSKLLISMYP